ncbi:MAG: hypothetical protein M1823_004935 [Watsoniomyces obsoletus]|nr:MAG: hypothetical protein M1823_004935 [Watsoniomyces obsoletus]
MHPLAHLPSYNPLSLFRMTGLVNHRGFSLSETPSLQGKVAVLTGGQAGIGREITAQLLLHGISKVYILARSEEKYTAACQVWAERAGLSADDVAQRTVFMRCDLTDLENVKRVADQLIQELDRLDILINNAGVPTIPDYILSPQGIETIFAANHMGHFVLTSILLPLLESTAGQYGDARIAVATSSFHVACQEIDFASLTSPTRTKSPTAVDSCYRYARSKLANILFTRELSRRLTNKGVEDVYVNCFFPGNIPTEAMDVWKELLGSLLGNMLKGTFQVLGQSELDAAATAIFLATSPAVVKDGYKGRYFIPIATEDRTSVVAEDKALATKLWEWTEQKVNETLGEGWAGNEG